jgi:hypothetical protein
MLETQGPESAGKPPPFALSDPDTSNRRPEKIDSEEKDPLTEEKLPESWMSAPADMFSLPE